MLENNRILNEEKNKNIVRNLIEQIKQELMDKEAKIKCFADIEKKPLLWLWKNMIPIGYITLVIGDPGVGKSSITCLVTSTVSKGGKFPFESSETEKGNVLFQNIEDDPEQVSVYRLENSNADLNKIFYIDGNLNNGFNLSNVEDLISKIVEINPKLIVIDPLTSYMDGTDIDKYKQVYDVLTPLSIIARHFQIAIIGVAHMNKSNTKAIYKTMGSTGFVSAARMVIGVAKNKEAENQRILCPIKGNYCNESEKKEYVFEITDNGIKWIEARTPLETESLFVYDNDVSSITATQWLVEYLNGMPENTDSVKNIEKEAQGANINPITLNKIRGKVCEKPFQKERKWNWKLKAQYVRAQKSEAQEWGE